MKKLAKWRANDKKTCLKKLLKKGKKDLKKKSQGINNSPNEVKKKARYNCLPLDILMVKDTLHRV